MYKLFKTCLGIIGLSLCLCIPSQNAEALLASSKHTMMGQTGVANPMDAVSVAYNPANSSFICDRFDYNLGIINTYEHLDVSGNAFGEQGLPYVNGSFNANGDPWAWELDSGIVKHLNCWGYDFTVGFALYNNKFVKTSYTTPYLSLLGNGKVGLDYLQEVIALNASYLLPTWNYGCHTIDQAVGLDIDVIVQRFKIKGIQNFDNAAQSAYPGSVTNNHFDWSGGCGVTLGWQAVIDNWFRVGISYQPKIRMSRFKRYQGFSPQSGRLDSPEEFTVGFAVAPACGFDLPSYLDGFTFAFDAKYIGFGGIKALANFLYPGINPFTGPPDGYLLGQTNGSAFGFKNQWQFKFGLEYMWNCQWTFRAGYIYLEPYYHNGQEAINLLTFEQIQNALTLGTTYQWNENWDISVWYVHSFEKKRTGPLPEGLGGGIETLTTHRDTFGFGLGRAF